RLLGAPAGGRREVLVHPGLEHDVVGLEVGLRRLQLLVVAPERAAAVAREVAGSVVAFGVVALLLHDRQPHEGLGARVVDSAGLQRVLVLQADVAQFHSRVLRNVLDPASGMASRRRRKFLLFSRKFASGAARRPPAGSMDWTPAVARDSGLP